mgnify:CR=1 FL=1
MSVYLARDWEVRALLARRMKRLIVPVTTCKPPWNMSGDWTKTSRIKLRLSSPQSGAIAEACPLRDEIIFKETWCLANTEYGTRPTDGRPILGERWAYYLASDSDVEHADHDGSPWRSAARMPPEWVRIRRRITSVAAKRFADFTQDDALGCGLGVITKDGSLFKHGIPDRDGLPGTDNTGWPWDEWEVDPRDALRRVLTDRYKKVDWLWIIFFA